jgi:hypothetical protein
MKTNRQLRKLIHTVLDCQTHFHKPTIIENDDFFKLGPHAIVVCSHCVRRLREAIGLKPGEPVGSPYRFDLKEREMKTSKVDM